MVILLFTQIKYREAYRWSNTEILKNLRRDSKLTHLYAGLLAEVARDLVLPAIRDAKSGADFNILISRERPEEPSVKEAPQEKIVNLLYVPC